MHAPLQRPLSHVSTESKVGLFVFIPRLPANLALDGRAVLIAVFFIYVFLLVILAFGSSFQQPAFGMEANRLFESPDLHRRSSEPDELQHESRAFQESICSHSEGLRKYRKLFEERVLY